MDEAAKGTSGAAATGGPGGTVIIRWWHEARGPGETEADAALRGTVLDLSGRTLGHFAGTGALFDLVRSIVTRPVTPRGPRPQ